MRAYACFQAAAAAAVADTLLTTPAAHTLFRSLLVDRQVFTTYKNVNGDKVMKDNDTIAENLMISNCSSPRPPPKSAPGGTPAHPSPTPTPRAQTRARRRSTTMTAAPITTLTTTSSSTQATG